MLDQFLLLLAGIRIATPAAPVTGLLLVLATLAKNARVAVKSGELRVIYSSTGRSCTFGRFVPARVQRRKLASSQSELLSGNWTHRCLEREMA